jgi:hypothetical protein
MDGKISYSKPNNGKRLFFKSDVLKYLDKNRCNSLDDIKANSSLKTP